MPWADFESAGIAWLLLAESEHSLTHFRSYQIYVDGSKRAQVGRIFSAKGWARPIMVHHQSAENFGQWIRIYGESIFRFDVYFTLAFPHHNGQWRYAGGSDVIATRAQRVDGIWVAGDDHALPLVAFMSSIESGPVVDQNFAKECADRYSGADKVELCRLVQPDYEPRGAALPLVLQGRFMWRRRNGTALFGLGRPSITVGLIGPDGSGKTTLCDLVEKTLNGWVVRAYLGQKGYVLPGVGWAERRGGSIFTKVFKYFGYPLDLFVRWQRISSRARGKIFLVDRLPMFPFASNVDGLTTSFYQRALPKFDLLVRLHGDDRVIYDRKPEGDFNNFSKNAQKARELDIGQLADTCVELDATKPLAEVLDALLASIFSTPTFGNRFLNQTSVF